MKWLPIGTITAVADEYTVTLYNVSGIEGGKVVLSRDNSFLSSLTYITKNLDPIFGKVAYFPVIGYDYASWEDKPIYEHNSSKKNTGEKAEHITMYEGWLTMSYKVNPSTISKDAFTVLGFDHEKVYTRANAADLDLEMKNDWTLNDGTLSVQIKGLNMKHYGNTYDDPLAKNGGEGIAQDDKFGNQADELALQIKNTKENDAVDGIVTSEYVTMKRMVVEQEDVMIGVNKDINLVKDVELFRDLHRMYPIAATDNEKNAYKSDLAVNINVPFDGVTDLNDYLETYAIAFNTNTEYNRGAHIDELNGNSTWQATLAELGFENLSLEYAIEPYTKAQVDQSQGAEIYSKEEVMKYLVLDGSKVSFHKENTASIGREPMIKVSLYGNEGGTKTLLMTKLLKLKVIRNIQEEELAVSLDHLKDQILPCKDFDGENTLGGYIDMDKVFNALNMSKEEFVNTYITLHQGWPGEDPSQIAKVEITRYEKAGEKTADGIPTGVNKYTNQHVDEYVGVNGENIEWYEDATFENNRLPLTIKTTALPGYYIVKITYATASAEAAYKSVVVYDDFRIDYPETSLTYNPNMWNGTENMLIYGHATEGDYTAPLVMEGYLENGFTKYNGSACPNAESTLHFEIITDNSTEGQYNKKNFFADGDWRVKVDQVTDGTGATKHQIKLDATKEGANFKYASMVGKDIYVRAYSIFNNILDCPDHTATENTPVCGTEDAHRADCANNATNSAIFKVKFVDPVAFDNYTNANWYLIDKAPSTAEYGYQVPLYRLFRIYDTHKSTTNGIIWEPTQEQGWWLQGSNKDKVGEGLRDLHNLKITYLVDITKNKQLADDGVLTNVRIDGRELTDGKVESEGPGILTWVNSGDAVISAQPIVVTVRAAYNWAPEDYTDHNITVYVYPANKEWPDPLPKLGVETGNKINGNEAGTMYE